jgi:hypothetical protein
MMQKILTDRLFNLTVLLYLALIFSFLLANIVNLPLWQDEAESALNAMTLNGHNVIPKAYEKPGLPMHECKLYFPQQGDPMYAYYPTAYYYSPYVTTHGWLPYYFIRAGILLFGKNDLGARFFSPVFFCLFLLFFYRLVCRYRGHLFGFFTLIGLSLMPSMLSYALQARYYAYSLFFVVWALDRFMRYLENPTARASVFLVLAEIFLYYTNLQYFILLNAAFCVNLLIWNRPLLLRYLGGITICFLAALPHLLLTKFFQFAVRIPKKGDSLYAGWKFLQISLNHNGFIVAAAILFIVLFMGRFIWRRMRKGEHAGQPPLDNVIFLLLVLGYPMICRTTPEMAFYERIFAALVPFIFYGGMAAISMLTDFIRNKIYARAAWAALCAGFLIFPVFFSYGENLKYFIQGEFAAVNIPYTDSRWVRPVIKYIKDTEVPDPLILTSFEHFVFTYYSDFDAQLLWPVKKEFIDTTKRNLFIVLEDYRVVNQLVKLYYPDDRVGFYQDEWNRNYFARLAKCKKIVIGGVTVYQSL